MDLQFLKIQQAGRASLLCSRARAYSQSPSLATRIPRSPHRKSAVATRRRAGSARRPWRDGRFRLSEAGIQSIVAAVEAHRNPAVASTLWIAVFALVVVALAALSFVRRSEDPHHSHLK